MQSLLIYAGESRALGPYAGTKLQLVLLFGGKFGLSAFPTSLLNPGVGIPVLLVSCY